MRSTFLLAFCFSFLISTASAQKDDLRYHPNSYKLELPDKWMKPKMIKTVTSVLSESLEELKEREFCTSGKADYSVQLLIDTLTYSNESTSAPLEKVGSTPTGYSYTYSFSYRFYAAVALLDSNKRVITLLQLVSRDELFNFSKQFDLYPKNGISGFQDVYDTAGRRVGRRWMEIAKPYPTEVPVHSPGHGLSIENIMAICEKKVYGIRKLLDGLN
jgi:hypothetical protein